MQSDRRQAQFANQSPACALGSPGGGPRRAMRAFVWSKGMRPLGDVSGVVVIPIASERLAILDELDYDRMCSVVIDAREYRIRPSEVKWHPVCNAQKKFSAGTTVPGPNGKPVTILLQWLVTGTNDSMKPLNRRRLDCRRCNWNPSRSISSKPCPICGGKRPGPSKLKKRRAEMLTYRFYHGRMIPFVACSGDCKLKADQKLTAILSAASIAEKASSVVYFISDEHNNTVKIGYSNDVSRRLSSLQTANRRTLRLLGVIPGVKEDESRWHERFASLRLNGEWFRLQPPLTQAIEEAIGVASQLKGTAQ